REMTDLPVWYSEYYGALSGDDIILASAYASIYRNIVTAGASNALLWNPNDVQTDNFPGLFTDVRQADGGVLTRHGMVYQWISAHFGPGTPLFAIETDSLDVEWLASDEYTMLINKSGDLQRLLMGSRSFDLLPWEVRLLSADGQIVGSTL